MNNILRLIRRFREITLDDLSKATKTSKSIISSYELEKYTPSDDRMFVLSNTLKVNPDIIFYSFGLFPPDIRKIIKNDPIYFVDKIRELCNNYLKNNKNFVFDEEFKVKVINYIEKSSTNGEFNETPS